MTTPDPAARPEPHALPPVATGEWDAEGRVARWSAEAEALFGWREEEVLGKSSTEWPFVHPGDARGVRRVSTALASGGERQTFSANRNLTRDGRVLFCEWYNTAVLGPDGRLRTQLSLVLDVTARVRAQGEAEAARRQAERAADRTRRLQALTAALSEALTPARVAHTVMDLGIVALGADGGVMVLLDEAGEELELVDHRGYSAAQTAAWSRFPLSAPAPIAEAVRTGEMQVLRSVAERIRRYPHVPVAEQYAMSVSVPLVVEGERMGAMGLSFRTAREFGDEDREFALALARQCAQAVRRARLYEAERRARAAAERAEAELAGVFAQAPVAICVVRGEEHRFEMANPFYVEKLGGRDPVGRTVREVFPAVEAERIVKVLDRVRRTGEPFAAHEVRIEYDRGAGAPEEAFFNLVYHPLVDEGGAVAGIVTIATEVTEQVRARRAAEESERQFRTLAESIPQLAWTADPDGAISWYNQRWYDYTGTTPEEMLGWGWRAVHDAGHLARVEERYRRAVAAGEPWEDTFPLRGRDGAFRRFLSRALPLRDAEGRVVRWFGTNTDVEEQLRAEEARARALAEAERARAAAEEANRAKSGFLATMSHEIRTPINAVMGYADLLEMELKGPLTDGQRQYVERVRASSRHLLGLVNDVLDFAKVEAGQMAFVRERVELRAAADDALAIVAPLASARGIEMADEPSDDPPASLADPDRVRQIALNLLSNAVKFTRPGGWVTVRCAVRREAPAWARLGGMGPWAVLEVEDTGIGIAPEQLARVFDPFTQVDETHTREAGGTGLGLAISRRFARLMGGDLTASSRPGVGSVFTLWLPAAGAAAELLPDGARGWPALPGEVPALAEAGRLLAEHAETVVRAWCSRVAADPGVPAARGLDAVQLEDHAVTFLAEVATALVVLDEAGGEPVLMRDGDSIQRTIASLHGAQRARLGFTAAELAREYEILREEVRGFLRRELEAGGGEAPEAALEVVDRLLERAARLSAESHAAVPKSAGLVAATRRVIDRTAKIVGDMREAAERRGAE